MRRRLLILVPLLFPAPLVAQSSPSSESPSAAAMQFVRFADLFGGRLMAAFDSIPAAKYGYRPTASQQTIGYIAQHLEDANYALCERLGDARHPRTSKDSLADTIKARWPKDTLVARLDASLRFCSAVLVRLGPIDSGATVTNLLRFETDLAEHYSQLSVYMRLLGMVPPSALPPKDRVAVDIPRATLSPYVGEYELTRGLHLVVTMQDGVLFIRSTPGGSTVRLWAENASAFFVKEIDAQVTFTRGGAGAVTGLLFRQFGRDWRATRLGKALPAPAPAAGPGRSQRHSAAPRA